MASAVNVKYMPDFEIQYEKRRVFHFKNVDYMLKYLAYTRLNEIVQLISPVFTYKKCGYQNIKNYVACMCGLHDVSIEVQPQFVEQVFPSSTKSLYNVFIFLFLQFQLRDTANMQMYLIFQSLCQLSQKHYYSFEEHLNFKT